MKEPEDQKLNQLLRDWQVKEPVPPRFQDNVWKRIEAAESRRKAGWSWPEWLTVLFARPAYATACAALLIVVGVSAGLWRANHDAARWDNQLAQRYVASVNPYSDQR